MFWELILAASIPSALFGMLVWRWQYSIKKRDDQKDKDAMAERKARDEREHNTEQLMCMIVKNSRATHVLAEATARAVQRIPDAHCNGDMKAALEEADRIQKEEDDFFLNQCVKHIVE